MKGKITFYHKQKGFGFMVTESHSKLFFHKSKALNAGIEEDELVEEAQFTIEAGQGKKGLEVSKFVLPKMACEITRERQFLSNRNYKKNFYLFLNKPYFVSDHSNMYALQPNKKCGFSLGTRFPKNEQNEFKDLKYFDFSGVDCSTITKSQKTNVKTLFPYSTELRFKPEWRLVLGLGGASVFETDITLHHIYGVPYIPASSIKGVVRSYIITEYFGNQTPEQEKDSPLVNAEFRAITTSKNFCKIFGCSKEIKPVIFENGNPKNIKKKKKWIYEEGAPVASALGFERRGDITFFDALPTDSREINVCMDIMNVHYKDYYESKSVEDKQGEKIYIEGKVKPPADWSKPTIINFLTVKNTTFQFLLASKNDSLTELKIGGKTIDVWLSEALSEHGIGAKTAVGYGYMTSK